ncbi:hypothetical protein [Spirosoma sp. 209]|uniref:hypothetical protein n=1 Tax=Spirosoma sp. 209 TaxID=1955701 RepID=UPI00098D55FA|nr:hypothetical protein [Spirosoma sp. 209]
MTNQPETAQIVSFPFPQQVAHECLYYRDGVFQLKLQAAQMLNDVAEGTYIMSAENIRAIHSINRKCIEVGLSPLDFELDS